MTWAVAWRPLAERDLTDCAAHIAQDNIDAALRFVDAVEETVASLGAQPSAIRAADWQSHHGLGRWINR